MPTPAPTPAPKPEALLSGRAIAVAATLSRSAKAKQCPKSAAATVKLTAGKLKITGKAKLAVTPTTVAGKGACRATGKVTLSAAPPAGAKVKIKISGKGLKTRTLAATR